MLVKSFTGFKVCFQTQLVPLRGFQTQLVRYAEAIVDFAAKYSKPFTMVPCCVFPVLFPHRTVPPEEGEGGGGGGTDAAADALSADEVLVTERRQLVRYLARKTGGEVAFLDFEGANQVVFSTRGVGFKVKRLSSDILIDRYTAEKERKRAHSLKLEGALPHRAHSLIYVIIPPPCKLIILRLPPPTPSILARRRSSAAGGSSR